jgi:trimethylguanosine synthase
MILIRCRKIAAHIAASSDGSRDTIIDAFAGVGGNAIAFALSGVFKKVIAFEIDPVVMACGQYNADIYGVSEKIEWRNQDVFEAAASLLGDNEGESEKVDVIFASPPWGGECT